MRTPRNTTILFLIVITATAAVPVAPQRANAATYLQRGKVLFAEGDFAAAIESFSKALELKPNWAQAYVERGLARRMHGELDKAIEDFNKATNLDPLTTRNNGGVAQAYTNHGQILATRFQLDEAIGDFDMALKLFDYDVRPYYERGQAKLLLEDFVGALADYDSYISKEKYDPFSRARAYLERGFTKHLLGRDKEAEEDMNQGVKVAGKDADELLHTLDDLKARLSLMRQIRKENQKKIG